MVINTSAKIAIVGDNRAVNSIWLDEVRNCFSAVGRSDVEFYNFAKNGNTANMVAEELEDAFSVSPNMLLIMIGYNDINMTGELEEKTRGFASALIKIIDVCKQKEITPILATIPAMKEGSMEALAEYAENSTPIFNVIRNLSEQNKIYLAEANEEFYLEVMENALSSNSLIEKGELTGEGNKVLGKIIAEELLGATFR